MVEFRRERAGDRSAAENEKCVCRDARFCVSTGPCCNALTACAGTVIYNEQFKQF